MPRGRHAGIYHTLTGDRTYLCKQIQEIAMADRIEQLKEFLKADPKDSFIRYALAQEYMNRGQVYQAKDTYEALRKEDPDYVGLYYHLGKLYEELDDTDKAIETYTAGIEVAKKVPDFHALGELNTARVNLEMEL